MDESKVVFSRRAVPKKTDKLNGRGDILSRRGTWKRALDRELRAAGRSITGRQRIKLRKALRRQVVA